MCGIIAIVNKKPVNTERLPEALQALYHRGPDMGGIWTSASKHCALGHRRLSIIDLSEMGKQPMQDSSGRYHIVLNGEIYNYLELKKELEADYKFITRTDTEVLLRAYEKWGVNCLDKLIGMFAFIIWDEKTQTAFAARDRFGVKPLYFATLPTGETVLASEIKAIHALGVSRQPDPVSWATYFKYGIYDHSSFTFWKDVELLLPGHALIWKNGELNIWQWYDLAKHVDNQLDTRPLQEVIEEYRFLLEESVRIRFRADVPIGINLSGGVDSSILLWLVDKIKGKESRINVFTFATGDANYDELPWVNKMLSDTLHIHRVCFLAPEEVPELAKKVQMYQGEPFGGIPTLAYSKVFESARNLGVTVLLDGQGLDEQWAGYDYYKSALTADPISLKKLPLGFVHNSNSSYVSLECLNPEFSALAKLPNLCFPFSDSLRNLQYKDIRYTKFPRAFRFNDSISMMYSTELREPFLDHRLFELAFRQPTERKIQNGIHKWFLRKMMTNSLPREVIDSPRRSVQTPQREWLRGSLRDWADSYIQKALRQYNGAWLDGDTVLREWNKYCKGEIDNSFYVFQWINLGLWCELL